MELLSIRWWRCCCCFTSIQTSVMCDKWMWNIPKFHCLYVWATILYLTSIWISSECMHISRMYVKDIPSTRFASTQNIFVDWAWVSLLCIHSVSFSFSFKVQTFFVFGSRYTSFITPCTFVHPDDKKKNVCACNKCRLHIRISSK